MAFVLTVAVISSFLVMPIVLSLQFDWRHLRKIHFGFPPGPRQRLGFGSYHYKYASGNEGDAPLVGIASRTNAITLYLVSDFDQKEKLLERFGKYKKGKGCTYIGKLEDINTNILMIRRKIQSKILISYIQPKSLYNSVAAPAYSQN
jgi:hypothetical protein